MLRTCRKCHTEKPKTKEYFKFTYKLNKQGDRFLYLEHTCKECFNKYHKKYQQENKSSGHTSFETLDKMIEFAQSLGFKSASYAIDKYGKEQFKKMYYENRQTNI